jgi:hypothetical protein
MWKVGITNRLTRESKMVAVGHGAFLTRMWTNSVLYGQKAEFKV